MEALLSFLHPGAREARRLLTAWEWGACCLCPAAWTAGSGRGGSLISGRRRGAQLAASSLALKSALLPAWWALRRGETEKNEKTNWTKARCAVAPRGRAVSKEDVVRRAGAESTKHPEETGRTREGTRRSATSRCPRES